jgi:hypothetical protein
MQKNITFSADEALLEKARAKAHAGNKELEDLFRGWLEDYTRDGAMTAEEGESRGAAYREVMDKLSHISTGGRKFTRDEMNER